MNAFRHLLMANVKEYARDRFGIFMTLAFPVLFMLLFGAIFSNQGTQNVLYRVGLVNPAVGGGAQAGLVQALKSVPVFSVSEGEEESEIQALKQGKRRAVVVLPEHVPLGSPSTEAEPGMVKVYYDGADQTGSQIVVSVVEKVLAEAERQFTARPHVFAVNAQAIQAGKGLRQTDYLLPGIMAMALMQLGLFGTMRFVSMRERKVFKRIGVTPLPKGTMVAAEVTVRLAMAFVQALLIILTGMLAYKVQMVGSWASVLALVFLGAVTFVSMGYMIASFVHSEDSAMTTFQLIQFPMMFLGGIFFPIEMMPSFLKPVVAAMPLTYLGDALRQVMVDAVASHTLMQNVSVLVGVSVASLLVAIRRFRWE